VEGRGHYSIQFFSKDIGIVNILSYRNINIFYIIGGIDR